MTFGIVAVTLLVFLATKQLAGASNVEFAQRVAGFLTVPIVTLLILFILIIALEMIET